MKPSLLVFVLVANFLLTTSPVSGQAPQQTSTEKATSWTAKIIEASQPGTVFMEQEDRLLGARGHPPQSAPSHQKWLLVTAELSYAVKQGENEAGYADIFVSQIGISMGPSEESYPLTALGFGGGGSLSLVSEKDFLRWYDKQVSITAGCKTPPMIGGVDINKEKKLAISIPKSCPASFMFLFSVGDGAKQFSLIGFGSPVPIVIKE